jgi:hypothetical protein
MGARKVTRRDARWRVLMASAVTPSDRLEAAHDRLRAGLAWLGRSQRDLASRARDRDMAEALAIEAAEFLNALSDRIDERRKAVTGREREPASQAR